MEIKNILWDFDGVILDSMSVRDWGFEEIFKHYPKENRSQLLSYHRENGGLSRYVKIRYFYEEILDKSITDEEINDLAHEFSVLMKKKLTDKQYLIQDTVDFIKSNYKHYNFHIVSGSDERELNYLCTNLGITDFFISIQGSPTPKTTLVNNLLKKYKYNKESTCLIGDSNNDLDAAIDNGIIFYGYNNPKLKEEGENYINSFEKIDVFN